MSWNKTLLNDIAKRAKSGKTTHRYIQSGTMMDELVIMPPMLSALGLAEDVDLTVELGLESTEGKLSMKVPYFLYCGFEPANSLTAAMLYAATTSGTFADLDTKDPSARKGVVNLGKWTPSRKEAPSILESDLIKLILNEGHDPYVHQDMDGNADIIKHVELLREATEYKKPIIMEFNVRDEMENVKMAVECGVDAVMVSDIGKGGLGSPVPGEPTLSCMGPALKAFEETSAREKGVKLLVKGDFRTSHDIYKALALGADAVGLTLPALLAISTNLSKPLLPEECVEAMAMKSDTCKDLDWKVAGKSLTNYLDSLKLDLKHLIYLSGHSRVRELSDEDIAAITYNAAAVTGVKLTGYGKKLPMWVH